MTDKEMEYLQPGDKVYIDSIEGFGGPAIIIQKKESLNNKFLVQMTENKDYPPFWAHDQEITIIDSRPATREHIEQVRYFLNQVISNLTGRAEVHDLSKLESPEKEIFDEYTPKLKACTYGSEEYKSYLEAMKPALDHHYSLNSHHPEFYKNGIRGMSLLDLIELVCDWKAATLRHNDGDIRRSVEINQKRFDYSDELKQIFLNTIKELNL